MNLSSRCFVAAIVGLAVSASADPGNSPADTRQLQEQIQSLQSQVKELQQGAAPQSQLSAHDVDAVVDSVMNDANRRSQLLVESGGFTGGWADDHFTIRSADGNYSFSPGIQFQFRSNTTYNDKVTSSGDANTDNGFEVRNLRLSFEGTAITKDLAYLFVWNTDRNSGGMVLEEAYVQYRFADTLSIKVGQYKEFIYHEQAIADKRQLAVDRSLLNAVFNSTGANSPGVSFVQGVDLLWEPGTNMRGDIAFTDGYASRNTNFQDPPANTFDFGMHGRFEWLVFGKDFKSYNQFTSMGNKSGDFLVVGTGGDWSQNGNQNLYHMNVDAQWNSGPWGAYVAWVGLYNDPGNGGNSAFDCGLLAQISYLLNTQWEIFGRYDYFHLDNNSIVAHGTENVFHEIVVGVNYYMHGHAAKFTLDAGWLPNGSPNSQTAIGVLANDGENEYFVRAQFSFAL